MASPATAAAPATAKIPMTIHFPTHVFPCRIVVPPRCLRTLIRGARLLLRRDCRKPPSRKLKCTPVTPLSILDLTARSPQVRSFPHTPRIFAGTPNRCPLLHDYDKCRKVFAALCG